MFRCIKEDAAVISSFGRLPIFMLGIYEELPHPFQKAPPNFKQQIINSFSTIRVSLGLIGFWDWEISFDNPIEARVAEDALQSEIEGARPIIDLSSLKSDMVAITNSFLNSNENTHWQRRNTDTRMHHNTVTQLHTNSLTPRV